MPSPGPAGPKLPNATWVRHLGSGGFADVHLYRQDVPERDVAVKVMRTVGNRQLDAAFRAEVNLMARMSAHPAIVSVFGVGLSDDGRQYIVMEYCPPPTLSQRARKRPYSVFDALDVGIRLAGAIGSLHSEGILHRDIKPSNVLFTEFGYPVLADFGLAGSLINTELTAGLGFSVPWAPPEQQNPKAVLGPSVDVYALAATIYTMLAGRAPFEIRGGDNSELSMIVRVKRQAVPPTGRSDVPPQLQQILDIAMSKDPNNRYSSVVEFAKMLQHVQVGLRQKVTPIDLLDEANIPEQRDDGLPETRAALLVLDERTTDSPPTPPGAGPVPRRAAPAEPAAPPSPGEPVPPDRATVAVEPEPVAPVGEGTRRGVPLLGLVVALTIVVLAGVLIVGPWLGSLHGEEAARRTEPAEDQLVAPTAVLPVPAAGSVADLQGELEGDQVRFRWLYGDDEVTFLYRVLDPLRSRETRQTTEKTVVVDREPGRTCLEVVVKWPDGRSSASETACVDTP